jgi:cytochrome P450
MYAFYLLALHPNVQHALYKEVCSIAVDGLPQFSDISSLISPMCIFYETLRLFPIIPTLSSRTKANVPFGEGVPIPKNTMVAIDLIGLHRKENIGGICKSI